MRGIRLPLFAITSVALALGGFAVGEGSASAKQPNYKKPLPLLIQNPEVALNQALHQLRHGKMSEALRQLQHLTETQPKFQAAQLLYSDLLNVRSGKIDQLLINRDSRKANVLVDELRLRWQHQNFDHHDPGIPEYLLLPAADHDYILLVDAKAHRLFVLATKAPVASADKPVVIADFYVSIGKGGFGKTLEGDNRTPIGIYTVTGELTDAELPELYGRGAFPTDYPNAWDRRNRRTGSGIWLHGVPRTTYNRAPRSSRGCVSMANADLRQLKPYIKPGVTPVIIANETNWLRSIDQEVRRQELLSSIKQWHSDWESRDLDRYMQHYASDFRSGKLGIKQWREIESKASSEVGPKQNIRLSQISAYSYPGEDDLVEVRFVQNTQRASDDKSKRKLQYWRRDSDGRWRIVQQEEVSS